MSFSSDTPYERWFGPEILSHSDGSVNLDRLNSVGVVLFNHDMNQVIGRIDKAWVDGNRGMASITFDDDEDAEKIFQKVQSGTLKGVSVGYRVNEWLVLGEKETSAEGVQGPAYIAKQWEPLEVSIVSVPADATVGVGRSLDDMEDIPEPTTPEEIPEETKEDKQMDEKIMTKEENEAMVRAERTRAAEITQLCTQFARFNLDCSKFIADGATVDQVRASILEKVAGENKPVEATVTVDERDKVRSVMSDALHIRAGIKIDKPAAGHEDFRHMSLLRLAEECLIRNGENHRGSPMEVAARALGLEIGARAIFGTSDFAYLLGATVNKSLMTAYNEAPVTYGRWCKIVDAPDFKTLTRVQLSESPDLTQVYENGEYSQATFSDARETYQILKYGKIFSISREAIVNDDLSALNRIPALFGAAAARKVNALAYGKLTSSSTSTMVADGVTLFNTSSHANVAATAAVISVESLGKARAAMAIQKGIGSKATLNLQPRYLLVPQAIATTAAQTINSVVDPSKNNAANNPFYNGFEVIADAILDANSSTIWYLAADYNQIDTVEVAFLSGNRAPYVDSRVGWEVDGMEYKVRIEAGACAVDYRGLYRNGGA